MHVCITVFGDGTAAPHADGFEQRVEASLKELHRKVDGLMKNVKDVNDLLDKLNTATNAVGADVQKERAEIKALQDQIAAGTPVSQEQLDAIAERLGSSVSTLEALAADPNNPVPDNPPVPATGG